MMGQSSYCGVGHPSYCLARATQLFRTNFEQCIGHIRTEQLSLSTVNTM